MVKIAVLGGGVTGLSAAYYLSKAAGLNCSRILLLEGSSRLGGWVQTTRLDDGTVFEHGPRSLRVAGGINTLVLADELGLAEDIVPVPRTHPASKSRYVYVNGKICPLPSGPGSLFKTMPPFSKSLIAHGWKEPFRAAPALQDDTIYNFFSRRVGEEIAKYAIDPLCRGVYAGDAKKLSIRACMSSVFNYEQKHGSIIRGVFKGRKEGERAKIDNALVAVAVMEKWAIYSFKRGLLDLTDALEEHSKRDARVEIRTEAPCTGLSFSGNKVKIAYDGKEEEFDHVISAAPSTGLAPLVADQHAILSKDLQSIPSVTVGVVNLEYKDTELPHQGFGHLIPSSEDSKVMGVIYESCIFPGHSSNSKNARLTCMMGGSWFEELFGDPDKCDPDHLGDVAVEAVGQQLGFKVDPSRVVCRIQKDCLPQYVLGHSQRVEDMFSYIKDNNLPLSLVGASYLGPSINNCIYNTKMEVERISKLIDE